MSASLRSKFTSGTHSRTTRRKISQTFITPVSSVAAKYCSLVEQEGGLSLLEELVNSNSVVDSPFPKVRELACVVTDNVAQWKAVGDALDDGMDDALDLDG